MSADSIGPSRQEIIKSVFLEEKFVDNQAVLEKKAAMIPLEDFRDLEHVLLVVNGFFTLSFDQQSCYVEAIEVIMETLGPKHLKEFVDKLFPPELEVDQLYKHLDVYLLLFDAVPKIIRQFQDFPLPATEPSTPEVSKKKVRGRASGYFSDDPLDHFKVNLFNAIEKLLYCQLEGKLPRVKSIIERISDALTQHENENKLLLIITTLLLSEDPDKKLAGLELIHSIVKNLGLEYIEGFVISSLVSILAVQNTKRHVPREIRRSGLLCFIKLLETSEIDPFYDKVVLITDDILKQADEELRVILLESAYIFINKMKFDYAKTKILSRFIEGAKSERKFHKQTALFQMHKVIKALILKIQKIFNPDLNLLNELFKLYFNIEHYAESLPNNLRHAIASVNYAQIGELATLYGQKLGPYMKYFFGKVDDSVDPKMTFTVKCCIADNLGRIAEALGREFVEKELIFIIDKKFLTLGPKTPQEVKTRTIQQLAKVLRMTAPTTRRIFADYYICLQDHVIKWRIRASICDQLEELINLFEPADTLSFIVPMFFIFCKDSVAAVRKRAVSKCHLLLLKVKANIPEHVSIVTENMKLLANESKFTMRLVFVDLFENLMNNVPNQVNQALKDTMLVLTKDHVVNVRIRVASFVCAYFQTGKKLDFCDTLLALLAKDTEKDVQKLVAEATAARNKKY